MGDGVKNLALLYFNIVSLLAVYSCHAMNFMVFQEANDRH